MSPYEQKVKQFFRELAAHLAYDAGVNQSIYTGRPYGSISLNTEKPEYLYSKILELADLKSQEEAYNLCFQPIIKIINGE